MPAVGVGAQVKLAGRIVEPYNGLVAPVKAIHGDRLIVSVTLPDGSRHDLAVSPNDVAVVTPAPKG